MFLSPHSKFRSQSGFSLVEVLSVIAVIGIISSISIPTISNIRESAKQAAAVQNAKNLAQMSESLAALGVAHVIPDSLGGVEATARLIREGVIVPSGQMAGEKFQLAALRDEDIEEIGKYLQIRYHSTELKLIFLNPTQGTFIMSLDFEEMLCRREWESLRDDGHCGVEIV